MYRENMMSDNMSTQVGHLPGVWVAVIIATLKECSIEDKL